MNATADALAEVQHASTPAQRGERQARNVVICFDGTNNEFGTTNTNVVRLVQALDRTPGRQRLYYDPGVGTIAEPGAFGKVRQWMSRIAGLAFGAGLDWKVQEAYTYLMDFWEPGDNVYIFGFSRGAYSARVLAGMLYAVGLLPRGAYNMVPYTMRLYRKLREARSKADEKSHAGEWARLCEEFRWTFARPILPAGQKPRDDQEEKFVHQRHFPVHFLGIWDTVSSVGWVWDPARFPYTATNPGVQTIRHAISVNERRWFFRQNQVKTASPDKMRWADRPQDVREFWFAGVHCDVGGGYSAKLPDHEDGAWAELWREPFAWMLAEAKSAGLLISDHRLRRVLGEVPGDPRPWADKVHESLEGAWRLAEYFPKRSGIRRRSGRNGPSAPAAAARSRQAHGCTLPCSSGSATTR